MGTTNRLAENLQALIGAESPPGEWFRIRQEDVNQFADVTHDHNFIHIDPERAARESPYGTTIAHGFFTISLMSHLMKQIPAPDPNPYVDSFNAINYGCDRLRLMSPVKVGSRIRARKSVAEANVKSPGMVRVAYDVTIDIEGEEKPACVARLLSLLLCSPD